MATVCTREDRQHASSIFTSSSHVYFNVCRFAWDPDVHAFLYVRHRLVLHENNWERLFTGHLLLYYNLLYPILDREYKLFTTLNVLGRWCETTYGIT